MFVSLGIPEMLILVPIGQIVLEIYVDIYRVSPKKKDESIAPLFIGGFELSIHQIKWLLIGYKAV
jgi:hypothetical protein